MKLKLLLLFLVVVGFVVVGNAQVTKPYTNLLITEVQMGDTPHNYLEITNMGNETVNLANFELGHVDPWQGTVEQPYVQAANWFMKLPKKDLAPGKSFLLAVVNDYSPKVWKKDPANYVERATKKEFYTVIGKLNQQESKNKISSIADVLLHRSESPGPASIDSITPYTGVLGGWGGRDAYFLRHHWIKEDGISKDSTVVDQVGGMFQQANGRNEDHATDVAGVKNATFECVLIRKNSVKTGNLNFNAGRGLDLSDSEWIPVPILGWYDRWGTAPWRAVFWTAGNQVNATLDANTLVSKTGKVLVDLDKAEITVPWGVRKNDSIMFQFKKTPGLAWGYTYSPNSQDSTFITARTGDILKLYVCGNTPIIKDFTIKTLEPTKDDNIVVPKTSYNYARRRNNDHPTAWGGMRVTHGVNPIDSITNLAFATRIDSLQKYLEKAPKATWEIVYKSGVAQPDLKTGDILRVKSESGKAKDYFIKLEKFAPNSNALLSSITWPDMPASFKGDIAGSYGWKGDTIPMFSPTNKTYVVQVPLEYDGIPALVFTKQALDSRVVVTRAKSLAGSVQDRTVTFKVTAENDTVFSTYTVRFDKEKDYTNVQPFIADPFISQVVFRSEWSTSFIELANPGTEPLDLSNYMIRAAYGTEANTWGWDNAAANWNNRYFKYVPGKKWQDEANWQVQPRILAPDNAVNAIVYPGDVFVMAQMTNCNGFTSADKHPYTKEMDVNFGTVPNTVPNWQKYSNPWNEALNGKNIPSIWCNNNIYLYKILNDSVKNGLKPATDRDDFQLIESFGGLNTNNWKIAGHDAGSQLVGFTRNSNIYKGNPEPNASWGTSLATSEWTFQRPSHYSSFNLGWPWTDIAICTGIGSLTMNEVTVYRSTVSSTIYKVSLGYSQKESIKGLTTGTTVTGFYNNIMKANEAQVLTVKSAATGAALAEGAAISKGDTLIVVSADTKNTSKYVLDVTPTGLSNNAILTSTKYTVGVTGSTGTIGGFPQRTILKTVFAGLNVPAGATITMVDENDAYMSLLKLNYDTAYVNVIATDQVFFEVVAENGTTKVLYQLKPNANVADAYVTSDVYSVDQFGSLIQFVPGGTSVHTLLNNLSPAPGATMKVYDKAGFARSEGDIYRDDKVVVTAADGKTTKAYYFSMLNFYDNKYFAFVISDDYTIDQVNHVITGPKTMVINEFFAKLYPSFGATLSVVDKNGIANTSTTFKTGDRLLVTAADGLTTAVYTISVITKAIDVDAVSTIKMYPNPTSDGKVIIQGLTKGNRVRVFNSAGITLRDVTVDLSTEYVSLAAQPAGIYVFVISNGDQHINIQKIVKK